MSLSVLQVATGFPSWGGTELHILNLSEQLRLRGYGGSVQILSLVAGRSTTNIIARVCAAYGHASQEQVLG